MTRRARGRRVRSGLRWWRRLLAGGAVAVLAVAAGPAARGEDPAPATEGPWVVEVPPDAVVIIDARGEVSITGDSEARLRACGLTPGCIAAREDGFAPVVVVGAGDRTGGAPRQGGEAGRGPSAPAP